MTTLRLFVEAIADDQADLAEAILATAVPESPDGSQATVASTIGVALNLLDTILGSGCPEAPAGIGARAKLPKGHWHGERAARDILDLARRGVRSVRSTPSWPAGQPGGAVWCGAGSGWRDAGMGGPGRRAGRPGHPDSVPR